MSFLNKIFGKKNKEEKREKITIYSPLDGKCIKIGEVPDETFAKQLLGNGIAVEPSNKGIIKAPIDGKIIQLFETNHAFVIETQEGVNVLVHFGLNTVNLKGNGFERIAKEGDDVKVGDIILKYDYDCLKNSVDCLVSPVVILDSEEYTKIKIFENDDLISGETKIIEIEL